MTGPFPAAGEGNETSFWYHDIKYNFQTKKAILISYNHANSSFLRPTFLSLHYTFAYNINLKAFHT